MTFKLLSGVAFSLTFLFVPKIGLCDAITPYVQTNLTSDILGVAANTDPNLVNPWGIAFGATSPFWISDNGTGLSTLYNGAGVPNSLVVTIPPPPGGAPPSAPTGAVSNTTASFGGARFLFATEDGTIAAWSSGTNATLGVDNSPSGAVYKGLAIGSNASGNLLYAANFFSGNIDVYNGTFGSTTVSGGFLDPTIPSGFAPFNIQNIGGTLYVTYAKQDAAKKDDVPGPGNGYVNAFNTDGVLLRRVISGGQLDSPWGLAFAPPSFGIFGSDLLVGNFGNGMIDAFNPANGAFLGALTDKNNNPLINPGLWALAFGNGGPGFDPNVLYFTAGIPGPDDIEDHGLFGKIQATPEPAAFLPIGLIGLALLWWRRRSKRVLPPSPVS